MKRSPQVPGEAKAQGNGEDAGNDVAPKKGAETTALNNIAGTTANDVGQERENLVRGQAMAAAATTGQAPDLAPAADIGRPPEPTSMRREAIINGKKVLVDIPIVRKNSAVEQFGVESRLPPGTLVNKDGTEFAGAGEAYGVIGHIDTPQGKLVNRIIPLDSVKEAA